MGLFMLSSKFLIFSTCKNLEVLIVLFYYCLMINFYPKYAISLPEENQQNRSSQGES